MICKTVALTRGRASRPTIRNLAVVVLLAFATCNEPGPDGSHLTPARKTLVPVPATEVATWKRIVSVTAPEGRFLQALAFDETRQVVVMFGGENRTPMSGTTAPTQDLWEWSPSTGAWTLRPATGSVPAARAGAAMVFDPVRNKMLLSGGRASSGYNYEDLWEWDPATGAWTERSGAGSHPSARGQHGMVYQKSTNKVLLFGGGRSDASAGDGTSMSASLGDTWELDPATGAWTLFAPAASPSVRHDFGLVWDSARDKVVLFGGMQVDIPGATGVPKQDTWDWDPATHTWTERTSTGSKPSQRYGHAMAFDGSRERVVVFGGWDMATSGSKNDLWSWDGETGAWTENLTGVEPGIPGVRSYASLVFDSTRARLDLIAGQVPYAQDSKVGYYGLVGSNEVWELAPSTMTFTDRSTGYQVPNARAYHAMAYNPATDKTYLFGGMDPMFKGSELTDLWEWDGEAWSKLASAQSPSGRMDTAMAYDPARKSLVLFGGNSWSTGQVSGDTWEWSSTTRQWTLLKTNGNPEPRWGHAMVTDTARNKILLFGGSASSGASGVAALWEWDGTSLTWTNRTPTGSSPSPEARTYPVISFDDGLGKLIVHVGGTSPEITNGSFWEWDGVTGGWVYHGLSDDLPNTANNHAVYDSARRRHVVLTDAVVNSVVQTRELVAPSQAWYVRSLATSPGPRNRSAMVYDSSRRVVVLFGGNLNTSPGGAGNDTWEYSVTNLANGEGCTTAAAATCASGNCVDGVCCDVAACTGACKSCNVPGSEGTCVLAQAGTEVPGSCADGQACDGSGTCKSKNGQACSAASSCASGFCTDGVCCDGACTDTCMACNLAARAGRCTAHAAGSDPDTECGQGSGTCKSRCDGVGACTFPVVTCDSCLLCDGAGTCSRADPACYASGGASGKGGMPGSGGTRSGGAGAGGSGSGGYVGRSGGSPGSGGVVGSGGLAASGGSRSGGTTGSGGASGGSGGTTPGSGGITSGSGGSVSRDAGGTGGSSGATGALDGGLANRDSGIDTGSFVASLQRGGCSCQVAGSNASPWLLLVGGALVAGRLRRRRS